MADKVMVSICCLAYNHSSFIRETIESFLMQRTDFLYEILIHDDASTDDTAEIIREYECRYPEIIHAIYQRENQHSKNINIFRTYFSSIIHGKYVAYCEGDDCWIDPMKLQKQVNVLENDEEYIACVGQTEINDLQTGDKRLLSKYKRDCDVSLSDVVLDWGRAFHLSSVLCLQKFGVDKQKLCQLKYGPGDYALAVSLLLSGKKVKYINDVMSKYRRNSCQTAWTVQNKNLMESIDKRRIKMLQKADEISGYRYHDVLNRGIISLEHGLYMNKFKKNFYKDKLLYNKFKDLQFMEKIYVLANLYIPHIYALYKKIRYNRGLCY